MCTPPTKQPAGPATPLGRTPTSPVHLPLAGPEACKGTNGSRRRRLWELGSHAHCPVIGVCLPLAGLRRLAGKVMGGDVLARDYELHCGAIAECRRRSPVALALHKELDRRYALALKQTASLKSTEALACWWSVHAKGAALPGAFWALLTHPRCNTALEETVLADVHMLQHQIGSLARADMARMDELLEENAVLARQLGKLQARSTEQLSALQLRLQQQDALLMRKQAELISVQTERQHLAERLDLLLQSAPDLPSREALAARNQDLTLRLQEAHRQLQRRDAEMQALQMRRKVPVPSAQPPDTTPAIQAAALCDLSRRAVLCVGGRPASVPVYRQVIEGTGGAFLHHDGGEEDKPTQLDANLAAADLVICQTACISHDAYWRVKDHCKRTGKPCVFIDTPSRTALVKALQQLPAPQAQT